MNFQNYVKDASTLLNHVADALGIDDTEKAARIFRAVLHAVRDRIQPEEAMHLGAHLPIIWKGIYFDGFSFSHRPVEIRTKDEWLEFIMEKSGAANRDFPTPDHAHAAFRDIMFFLELMLPDGQFNHVLNALHGEIQELVIEEVAQ